MEENIQQFLVGNISSRNGGGCSEPGISLNHVYTWKLCYSSNCFYIGNINHNAKFYLIWYKPQHAQNQFSTPWWWILNKETFPGGISKNSAPTLLYTACVLAFLTRTKSLCVTQIPRKAQQRLTRMQKNVLQVFCIKKGFIFFALLAFGHFEEGLKVWWIKKFRANIPG